MSLPPLSLYLHFPWCVKKCPYCDFNSHPQSHGFSEQKYIAALLADLDFELDQFEIQRPIVSIFMGGGTPSLFGPDSMALLLQKIQSRLEFSKDIEITMEANPGTTEYRDFSEYRAAGINRLSLGVQSFNTIHLKNLGRIHSAKETYIAFERARSGGFDNINIDLMFGLPNQTTEDAIDDLNSALNMKPEHLSLYQLTLEPNTVFYRYPPALPDDDRVLLMQTALQQLLKQSGYEQYEVSAYAKAKRRCHHNMNYWHFGDYLGLGAGGHGKITTLSNVLRRSRKKHPATFLQLAGTQSAIASCELIPNNQLLFELLMNGLRLKNGVPMSLVKERTTLSHEEILGALDSSIKQQLVEYKNQHIQCSERGYLFLDEVLQQLL